MHSTLAHRLGVAALLALIALGLAWELWLAPLRPGSLMALKVVPLAIPLTGLLKRNLYTMQWSAMLILIYLTEGVVRATSDHGLSAVLAMIEVVLVVIYFGAMLMYLRPYKRAARARLKSGESVANGAHPGEKPA